MIKIDFSGRSALITGGTKGIGLAAALEFARAGARTYLTYKWGSADRTELFAKFEREKLIPPVLIEADASIDEDTDRLLAAIREKESRIDYFVSNVAFAARVASLDHYQKRALYKSFDYSTWPFIEYTKRIIKAFGAPPRYVLGVSSAGPDHYYEGYDFVAASKALLEFLGRYLAMHLITAGTKVNVLRFGMVKTDSFNDVFGKEFFNYIEREGYSPDIVVSAEDCGRAILGVCSGYLDALHGQVITLDRGWPLRDNLVMRYYDAQKRVDKKAGS